MSIKLKLNIVPKIESSSLTFNDSQVTDQQYKSSKLTLNIINSTQTVLHDQSKSNERLRINCKFHMWVTYVKIKAIQSISRIALYLPSFPAALSACVP